MLNNISEKLYIGHQGGDFRTKCCENQVPENIGRQSNRSVSGAACADLSGIEKEQIALCLPGSGRQHDDQYGVDNLVEILSALSEYPGRWTGRESQQSEDRCD